MKEYNPFGEKAEMYEMLQFKEQCRNIANVMRMVWALEGFEEELPQVDPSHPAYRQEIKKQLDSDFGRNVVGRYYFAEEERGKASRVFTEWRQAIKKRPYEGIPVDTLITPRQVVLCDIMRMAEAIVEGSLSSTRRIIDNYGGKKDIAEMTLHDHHRIPQITFEYDDSIDHEAVSQLADSWTRHEQEVFPEKSHYAHLIAPILKKHFPPGGPPLTHLPIQSA